MSRSLGGAAGLPRLTGIAPLAAVGLTMSPGEIMYVVLLGIILVWVADIFRLWEPWAAALTRVWHNVRGQRDDPS
jgi:hypothetical protein